MQLAIEDGFECTNGTLAAARRNQGAYIVATMVRPPMWPVIAACAPGTRLSQVMESWPGSLDGPRIATCAVTNPG